MLQNLTLSYYYVFFSVLMHRDVDLLENGFSSSRDVVDRAAESNENF